MKQKQYNNISESQVEDALVANLQFLKKILRVENELKLIARQLRLKNGERRIDLLVSSGKDLCLVELKVVKYSDEFLLQIVEYRDELISLQKNGELISGKINSFLLVTDATQHQIQYSKLNDVEVIVFKPIDVLTDYYKYLSLVAPFLNIKPNDYGVMNIGKINATLYELSLGLNNENQIAARVKLAKGSVNHHLKLGTEFGLVRKRKTKYFLTDLGDKYISDFKNDALKEKLTINQIKLLKKHISDDPFYSSSVFGIYSIVESVFLLARNKYPVELIDLQKMFQTVGGKVTEWQSSRALTTATYTFLNFAIDLELLGKIGKQIVITPAGFKFILMLQLHKSIEMIESLFVASN
jgi:hypothetical protein